ncbi:MAG TPA: class I SAM-dependent methyltransferase [Aquihabitans sp.]|nr:class I SAM-dependent methyltransferase [Aquihabitans sp.]
MTAADPGSFRDPLSQVFVADGEVLRGLTAEGLREYEAVAAAPFFAALQAEGLVVATEQLAPGTHVLHDTWAGVLRHERVPVISYPYEWTFEMLRDAALLQLEVTRRAVAAGCTTKDATSYNVAFRGTTPVFIDVGSFEEARPGEPWPGYGQFCELFLNPLVVQALGGIDFQAWLRGAVNGISSADAARVVPARQRLGKGLLVHLTLHARAEQRYAEAGSERGVKGELRQAGFGPKIVLAQLDNLEKTVRGLRWEAQRSEWSDYSDRSHYTGQDLPAKEAFVAAAVASTSPGLVLDLGANDGRFSKLALEHGAGSVVAADVDHLVVDRLYRHLRDIDERRILPLVLDLANPSPGTGWRSRERRPFVERVRPDLVLCLAVVHHLALTYTVPFDEIVALLADFDAPLVVELPHPDDPMVEALLARKRPGLFDHYGRAGWEAALGRRFSIDQRDDLRTRTLYRCTPLPRS